jgi:hypothetical protein
MKATIFSAATLFALTLLGQPSVYGRTPPPVNKATAPPTIKAKEPQDQRRKTPTTNVPDKVKLEPPTPTKSVDVEIKKFYIVKEVFVGPVGTLNGAPFTVMVHVVNFRKEKIIFARASMGLFFLDGNKKIMKEFVTPGNQPGTTRSWETYSYVDLKPGENVVKVPFLPPSRWWIDPFLKKNNWKFGFQITVARGVAIQAPIFGGSGKGELGDEFKGVSYIDFLPEQYTLP